MNDHMEHLYNMSLFTGIKNTNLKSMLKCMGSYVKSFKKGEYISLSEDPLKSVGIVLSGTVHMLKDDVWGNENILTLAKKGELFGETFACGSTLTSTVSFFAASDSEILFLPFEKIMRSYSLDCIYHHIMIENMIILIADKNVQLMEKLEILSKKNLREKIMTFLSLKAQRNDNNKYLVIEMGRLEMADYLCVNRSALTRELSNMSSEGIIDYHKNTFRLL